MVRSFTCSVLAAGLLVVGGSLAAQDTRSDAEKIADLSRTAPATLIAGATLLDWPAAPDADFRVMRQGTNDWVCLPNNPGMPNDEPMCLDQEWMGWLRAFATGTEPQTKRIGLSYMLNSQWGTSNVDPAATEATPHNHWVEGGSHLMMVVPDPALLAGFPTEPREGEPYVMWKDTPYVHLMIPIPEAHAAPLAGHR